MTDRELLELAAKAAGYESDESLEYDEGWGLRVFVENGKSIWWNPLTDDGNALRMAVKLGMDLLVYPPERQVQEPGHMSANTKALIGYGSAGYATYRDGVYVEEYHENDPYAATRRAIVRAAADIGKDMK